MIGNVGQDIGEPGLWIDAVEFCCFDHGVGNCCCIPTAFGSNKEVDEMTVVSTGAKLTQVWSAPWSWTVHGVGPSGRTRSRGVFDRRLGVYFFELIRAEVTEC